jgi:hypothetical protein
MLNELGVNVGGRMRRSYIRSRRGVKRVHPTGRLSAFPMRAVVGTAILYFGDSPENIAEFFNSKQWDTDTCSAQTRLTKHRGSVQCRVS